MVPFTKLSILWCPYSFLLSPAWLDLVPIRSSIWPGVYFKCVRIYSKPLGKPYRSTPFKFKDIMKKLESSSLAVQTTLEIGGEDFCGHYKHRKQVTVGVRSSSIGAFLCYLGGCQPPLANSRQAWKVTRVFLRNRSFLADTLWIMIYDGGGWVWMPILNLWNTLHTHWSQESTIANRSKALKALILGRTHVWHV